MTLIPRAIRLIALLTLVLAITCPAFGGEPVATKAELDEVIMMQQAKMYELEKRMDTLEREVQELRRFSPLVDQDFPIQAQIMRLQNIVNTFDEEAVIEYLPENLRRIAENFPTGVVGCDKQGKAAVAALMTLEQIPKSLNDDERIRLISLLGQLQTHLRAYTYCAESN